MNNWIETGVLSFPSASWPSEACCWKRKNEFSIIFHLGVQKWASLMRTKWAKLQGSVSSRHSRAVNTAWEPMGQHALSPCLMLREASLHVSVHHFLPVSIPSLQAQLLVRAWECTDVFWKVRRLTELLKLDNVNVLQAGSRWSWSPSMQNYLRPNIDLSIF